MGNAVLCCIVCTQSRLTENDYYFGKMSSMSVARSPVAAASTSGSTPAPHRASKALISTFFGKNGSRASQARVGASMVHAAGKLGRRHQLEVMASLDAASDPSKRSLLKGAM